MTHRELIPVLSLLAAIANGAAGSRLGVTVFVIAGFAALAWLDRRPTPPAPLPLFESLAPGQERDGWVVVRRTYRATPGEGDEISVEFRRTTP